MLIEKNFLAAKVGSFPVGMGVKSRQKGVKMRQRALFHSDGVFPVLCLKQRLKYFGSVNPLA